MLTTCTGTNKQERSDDRTTNLSRLIMIGNLAAAARRESVFIVCVVLGGKPGSERGGRILSVVGLRVECGCGKYCWCRAARNDNTRPPPWLSNLSSSIISHSIRRGRSHCTSFFSLLSSRTIPSENFLVLHFFWLVLFLAPPCFSATSHRFMSSCLFPTHSTRSPHLGFTGFPTTHFCHQPRHTNKNRFADYRL